MIINMRQEIGLNLNAYTVGLDVFGKMIAAHETFVTDGTSKSFFSRVSS